MNIASPKQRLYIHETIEISIRYKQQYIDHFMSWGPISRRLYGMRLCGVWATNGSTDRWPEAIVLWEMDGTEGLTQLLSGEYAFLHAKDSLQQDHYKLFWDHAPEGVKDTSGLDRLLAPTQDTPALADAVKLGLGGAGYLHETFTGPPGSINAFLQDFSKEWRPVSARIGLKFVGAYRTMMRNDNEAIVIWAIPSWKDWGTYELAQHSDPAAIAWRTRAAKSGINWSGKLLHAALGNPLDTGKLV